MKVLYVCRLFSGLGQSIATGVWEPTGVPAISRMIESLDRNAEGLAIVFICRDPKVGRQLDLARRSCVAMRGLRQPVTIVNVTSSSPHRMLKFLSGAWRELICFWEVFRELRRFKPNLIYVDHANALIAGVLARISKIPVVLRLMGSFGVRHTYSTNTLGSKVLRWSYLAPYAFVVCTQDGSGGEIWMEKVLHREVPRQLLLNGIDADAVDRDFQASLREIGPGKLKILFVGRLEREKGCDEFVEAFLRLRKALRGRAHAVIVGVGSRMADLRAAVIAASAEEDVTFIDRLSHSRVMAAYCAADIYVSLNWVGNLSNANMEAMSLGKCVIVPESDPEKGIDLITDELLGSDAVVRISRANPVMDLTVRLIQLCENEKLRMRIGAAAGDAARRLFKSWEQRIGIEQTMLENVVRSVSVADDHQR